MKHCQLLMFMILTFPALLLSQNEKGGTAFTAGYGFLFANETTGMHLSAGYKVQYPVGKNGFMSSLEASARYSGIPQRTETHSHTPEGWPYYSRQTGQFYIFNLGMTGGLGYRQHFIDFGIDAQLWQFRGTFLEEYNNLRWKYQRSEVNRYLGAVLGYSYKPVKGLGFSAYWNPQIDFLDEPRTRLRKENFAVLVTFAF